MKIFFEGVQKAGKETNMRKFKDDKVEKSL